MTGALLPGDYPSHFAALRPDAPAIIFGPRSWSYRALDRASDAFAAFLVGAGIARGDRIACLGRNSDLFFPILFGAMRAGVVLVPVNWRNTAIETRFVLGDSGSRLVLVDAEFVASIIEAAPAVPRVVIDGDGRHGLRARIAAADAVPRTPLDADAPALLLYTNGTTGKPKGVITTQHDIVAQRQAELASGHLHDWGRTRSCLPPCPIFTSAGCRGR